MSIFCPRRMGQCDYVTGRNIISSSNLVDVFIRCSDIIERHQECPNIANRFKLEVTDKRESYILF